jgi:hypothetical protein
VFERFCQGCGIVGRRHDGSPIRIFGKYIAGKKNPGAMPGFVVEA